jgi:hypothetical protein
MFHFGEVSFRHMSESISFDIFSLMLLRVSNDVLYKVTLSSRIIIQEFIPSILLNHFNFSFSHGKLRV